MSEHQSEEQAEQPVEPVEPVESREPVEPVEPGEPHEEELAGPAVAAATARLDGLGERPPEEHVEVYDEVHQVLQRSLAEAQTDNRPPPAAPPGS